MVQHPCQCPPSLVSGSSFFDACKPDSLTHTGVELSLLCTTMGCVMQELIRAVGDATFGGEMLETVQETQNDEEEQALTSSQVWDSHKVQAIKLVIL